MAQLPLFPDDLARRRDAAADARRRPPLHGGRGVQYGVRLLKGIAALHRLDIATATSSRQHPSGPRWPPAHPRSGRRRQSRRKCKERGQPARPASWRPNCSMASPPGWNTISTPPASRFYHLLTRKYPYGEIEPSSIRSLASRCRRRAGGRRSRLGRNLLLKAVARDPKQRFETAEEFLLALERGVARPLAAPVRRHWPSATCPALEKSSLVPWQSISCC